VHQALEAAVVIVAGGAGGAGERRGHHDALAVGRVAVAFDDRAGVVQQRDDAEARVAEVVLLVGGAVQVAVVPAHHRRVDVGGVVHELFQRVGVGVLADLEGLPRFVVVVVEGVRANGFLDASAQAVVGVGVGVGGSEGVCGAGVGCVAGA